MSINFWMLYPSLPTSSATYPSLPALFMMWPCLFQRELSLHHHPLISMLYLQPCLSFSLPSTPTWAGAQQNFTWIPHLCSLSKIISWSSLTVSFQFKLLGAAFESEHISIHCSPEIIAVSSAVNTDNILLILFAYDNIELQFVYSCSYMFTLWLFGSISEYWYRAIVIILQIIFKKRAQCYPNLF